MTLILLGMIPIFISSILQSAIGFGFSLVVVPALLFIFPQHIVVPLIVIITLVLNSLALLDCYKHVQIRTVFLLALGGVIGVPLGTMGLTEIDTNLFKAIVGGIIIIFAILLKVGWQSRNSDLDKRLIPVGILSGVLNGSMSLSGPPVILFFAQIGVPKAIFRANILGYFWLLNVFTLIYFFYLELITEEILIHSGIYLPILVLGTFIGVKGTHLISESLFKQLTLLIVGIMGVLLIGSNITNIF